MNRMVGRRPFYGGPHRSRQLVLRSHHEVRVVEVPVPAPLDYRTVRRDS